eukprot:TRINITY_DN816_c0_g1_i1.p2 TRINITY_DN816_c0_g1~~TRINITY_DN816_c0_g1_i1.p2  ORF type:complete len:203 (-),score=21.56 TRINITY_DN816_c0_g1_i1:527-1135(-)
MDRYVRVEKPKQESTPIQENEVRIMANGRIRNYITYAMTLMTEKNHESVQLKAIGRAIIKTVSTAEILKRRIGGLHQVTEIGSIDITDQWEPIEEGLSRLETTRHVSIITITLSRSPLDLKQPGYQPPLPEDLVKIPLPGEAVLREVTGSGGGGRGGGRGRGAARGRGRGRGRGSRGRGRGRGRRSTKTDNDQSANGVPDKA